MLCRSQQQGTGCSGSGSDESCSPSLPGKRVDDRGAFPGLGEGVVVLETRSTARRSMLALDASRGHLTERVKKLNKR